MRVMSACLVALSVLACASSEPARRRASRRRSARPSAVTRPAPPPAASSGSTTSFYTPAPGAPSNAPPSRVSAPVTADPRCREILERNEREIARVASIEACAGAGVASLRSSFGACAQTADGAWAPEIVAARARSEGGACDFEVQWHPLLFHRGGVIEGQSAATGRVDASFRLMALGDEVQEHARFTFTASDLDGDHLPELVIDERFEDHGTQRARTSIEVLTGAQGEVRVYEPTRAMVLLGADDVDDDGRVDFFVPSPYTWTEGTECGLNLFHDPLVLVAHALPGGGFATDDEVAARQLRQVCPSLDGEPVAPRSDDTPDPVGLRVVCRRLWGASPDEALAPLRCARFRAAPSIQCERTSRRLEPLESGECPAHYDAWAHQPPPLRLR